jgi:hypothetical protein
MTWAELLIMIHNRKLLGGKMRLVLLLLFSGLALNANAWTSGPEPGGIKAARALLSPLMINPENEHADLFDLAMKWSGLPTELRDTFELPVYSTGLSLPGGLTSLNPVPFDVASEFNVRQYTIAGFASLPDHSYSIADWAKGNEECPSISAVGESEPIKCHTFSQHLGLVNSTHFPPQSQTTYSWYHNLAMSRADECKVWGDKLNTSTLIITDQASVEELIKSCERQALSIEAMGQHFLQDTWAIGHMWERWGSGNLSAFDGSTVQEKLKIAKIVGAVSGLLHGAQSFTKWPDQMSAGEDAETTWKTRNLTTLVQEPRGIGDFHANKLVNDVNYVDQLDGLYKCSIKGMRDVYSRTSMMYGPMSSSIVDISSVSDPSSDQCFSQRATNRAIARGWSLDLPGVTIPLTPEALTLIVLFTPIPSLPALSARLATDLVDIKIVIDFYSKNNPSGHELADIVLPELLNTKVNSQYNQVAPYIDPQLPWPKTNSTLPDAQNVKRIQLHFK